jgi:hypothetical protein
MERVVSFYGTERYGWSADPPPGPPDLHVGDVYFYMKKLGEDGWELVGAESKKYLLLIFKRSLEK